MSDDPLDRHLDLETLERFAARELSPDDTVDAVLHLHLCRRCAQLLDQAPPDARRRYEWLVEEGALDPLPRTYDGLHRLAGEIVHAIHLQISIDREISRGRVARLLEHPPERRHLMVEGREEYREYRVAAALLDACRAGWTDDPAQSEDLAELALVIADLLDPDDYPEDCVNDLRAEAWGAIANCRRIRSGLHSVSEAFELAEVYLHRGTRDPSEEAHLLDLRASFLIDQRRFDEAEAILDRLVAVYRDLEEPHLEARMLMNLARLRREEGRVEESIPLFEQAAAGIDPTREPHLDFMLKKNLALALAEAGRGDEARDLLPEVRRLAGAHASRLEWLRHLWTEALIYHRLGSVELAAEALAQARDGFDDLGLDYDTALATLDLAVVYLDLGDGERAAALGHDLVPLFRSRSIHREALVALGLVQRAMEARTLTRHLLEEVAAFLRRSRINPSLRFGAGPEAEGADGPGGGAA